MNTHLLALHFLWLYLAHRNFTAAEYAPWRTQQPLASLISTTHRYICRAQHSAESTSDTQCAKLPPAPASPVSPQTALNSKDNLQPVLFPPDPTHKGYLRKEQPLPAHPIPPHLPKVPHLFWPRMQAWSTAWFRRGLGHADNPERKTCALWTHCPLLPQQPSCHSLSLENRAGLPPWQLAGRKRAGQPGQWPCPCSMPSASPLAPGLSTACIWSQLLLFSPQSSALSLLFSLSISSQMGDLLEICALQRHVPKWADPSAAWCTSCRPLQFLHGTAAARSGPTFLRSTRLFICTQHWQQCCW